MPPIEPIDVLSIARMLLYMTQIRGSTSSPRFLGHDNLDGTAHYAQVSTRLMMDTYNAAHPHAKVAA